VSCLGFEDVGGVQRENGRGALRGRSSVFIIWVVGSALENMISLRGSCVCVFIGVERDFSSGNGNGHI
jgi:hypothetical protein